VSKRPKRRHRTRLSSAAVGFAIENKKWRTVNDATGRINDNDDNQVILRLLDERIAEIARAVLSEISSNAPISTQPLDSSAIKLRGQLALIKAKEYITIREAALLMTCSDSHIRKLVMLVRKRITARRISFVELEGITVFTRHHLAHPLNSTARDAILCGVALGRWEKRGGKQVVEVKR
jgi:hypothetical protein